MWQRIRNLVRGGASIFVSGLEKKNPEALLAAEQDNLREQIQKFNASLAAHAGLVEKLIAQVRKLETEDNDLRAKIGANLKLGSREAAGNYALRLKGVERELEQTSAQMQQAEKTYKELVRARNVAVSAAKSRIEALKSGISDMKMRQAMAELTEMASGMVGGLGGGESMERLEEIVNEERYKAAGRVRVAVDNMDVHDAPVREAEQGLLAEQALAEFEADQAGRLGRGSEAKELGSGTGTGTRTLGAGAVRGE